MTNLSRDDPYLSSLCVQKLCCGTAMETLQISEHKYNLRWPDYHNTILSTFRLVNTTAATAII